MVRCEGVGLRVSGRMYPFDTAGPSGIIARFAKEGYHADSHCDLV
jgi:hypothetical protein